MSQPLQGSRCRELREALQEEEASIGLGHNESCEVLQPLTKAIAELLAGVAVVGRYQCIFKRALYSSAQFNKHSTRLVFG